MLKAVVDQRLTVVKEYPGSKASLSYLPGQDAYLLVVEGQKVTYGMVHRAALDLGVKIEAEHLIRDKDWQFIVTFLEG